MLLIINIFIFILLTLSFIQSSSFLGGTISWKPLNNRPTSSVVSVMFTQSYQWKASATTCNQSYVQSLSSMSLQFDRLQCVTNSNLCGGFSSLNTRGYCIDSSIILDSRSTQISNIKNITVGSIFCIAFQSISSRIIRLSSNNINSNRNRSKLSIGSCINMTIRSDGFINTSPVTTIISPLRVPINSVTKITIPIMDIDNDYIRCRWTRKTSRLDECGDQCGIIEGTLLDSNTCTLIFNSTNKNLGEYYHVALMIEDFINSSSNISLSSVPIQFLIEIINTSSCLSKPMINSNLSNCISIEVGIEFNFSLIITQGCSNTTIDDLFTVSPLYMYRNNLTQNGLTNEWIVRHRWTPNIEQIGIQMYCAVATDSDGIQSDQYCLTFNVVSVGQDVICPDETAVSSISKGLTKLSLVILPRAVVDSASLSNISNIGYQFSSLDLALGLGLGIPLTLIGCALILCMCFCKQSKCINSIFCRRDNNQMKSTDNHSESIEKPVNNIQENKDVDNSLPDYRQQYVNDGQTSRTNKSKNVFEKNHLSTLKNSDKSTGLNDFQQSSMNLTKTTYLSSSSNNFTTNQVQFTKDYSSKTKKTSNNGSILIRAYFHQENQKMNLK